MKPFEPILKEDNIAQSAFIVLEGSMSVWRAKPSGTDQEAAKVLELREGNLKVLANKKHKTQADYDKVRCPPRPAVVVPPTCNLSSWACIRPRLEQYMRELKQVLATVPSTSSLEYLSESACQFSHAVNMAHDRCHAWIQQCKNAVGSDFDDVCSYDKTCNEGRKLEQDLLSLRGVADKMRKELLLRKFLLQLSTCQYEYAPTSMEPPYCDEQANGFIEMLHQQGKAYVICDRQMNINQVSRGFIKLTGYDQDDCLGVNPTRFVLVCACHCWCVLVCACQCWCVQGMSVSCKVRKVCQCHASCECLVVCLVAAQLCALHFSNAQRLQRIASHIWRLCISVMST